MDPSTDGREPAERDDDPPPAADTVVRPTEPPPAPGTVVRPPGGDGGADGTAVRPPSSTPADDQAGVRFGPGPPGVGEPAPAAPGWTATARDRGARRGRRLVTGAGALVTALVVAAVLLHLSHRPSPALQVTGASVAPAVDPGHSCDTGVDVVGTVHTNGSPGRITYRWLRSDGNRTDTLSQTVGDGATSVQVHLQWKVTGQGRYPATATLQVVQPNPVEAQGGFVYDCP